MFSCLGRYAFQDSPVATGQINRAPPNRVINFQIAIGCLSERRGLLMCGVDAASPNRSSLVVGFVCYCTKPRNVNQFLAAHSRPQI